MFRKFDPIRRMIISRDSGLINEYFTISKGQLIDLEHFCTLQAMPNDRPQTYPVHPNEKDKKDEIVWVTKEDVKKYKSGIVKLEY